jgi:hypothetical protein
VEVEEEAAAAEEEEEEEEGAKTKTRTTKTKPQKTLPPRLRGTASQKRRGARRNRGCSWRPSPFWTPSA